MELKTTIRGLQLAGFLDPEARSSPGLLQRAMFGLVLLQFVLAHVLMVVYYMLTPATLYRFTNATISSLNGAVTLFRIFFFIARRDDISKLIKLLRAEPDDECPELATLEMTMRRACATRVRRLGLLLVTCTVAVAAFMFGLSAIVAMLNKASRESPVAKKPKPILIFGMWWFTDWRTDSSAYQTLITWQTLVILTYLAVSYATDAFICDLLHALATRTAVLAERAPAALLPAKRVLIPSAMALANMYVTPACRAWLRRHQHYFSLLNTTNLVMGPLILASHFLAMTTIIAYTYFAFNLYDKTPLSLLAFFAIATSLIQLFAVSHAGQEIIDQTERLSRSVMSAGQVERGALAAHEGPECTVLQVVVARVSASRKVDRITGMSFFTVSRRCFSSILSASLTYLLFLLSFESGRP